VISASTALYPQISDKNLQDFTRMCRFESKRVHTPWLA
jgi:hypothetical protein